MKKFAMRTAAALFLAATAAAAATGSELTEKNKAVARRVVTEILSKGRFDLAKELYAPDFVNHGLTRNVGLAEDQAAARGWLLAFPDGSMSVDQMIAEDDRVCVLWTGGGTNTGQGNGLPATGRKASIRGITIWRIVDGRIREEWSSFDQLSLMTQLGLLPSKP
jgi:steroid delta-isomerase-like uncharacterized protein